VEEELGARRDGGQVELGGRLAHQWAGVHGTREAHPLQDTERHVDAHALIMLSTRLDASAAQPRETSAQSGYRIQMKVKIK